MELDFSLLTTLSNGILLVITFLVWYKIHSVSHLLNIPNEKKKWLSSVSFVLLFGWLALSYILASLDWYHVTPEIISPGIPLGFLVPVLLFRHYLNKSETLQQIVEKIPNPWIIAIQTYRLLGVVFLVLLAQNRLPALFALPSGFGDILVGLSAPIVAFFLMKKKPWSRSLARLWNYVGILDLLIAIGVGVTLALPSPFSLISTTPTTEIMTTNPLALIPVFAVPLGMIFHLASLRKLAYEK